MTGTRGGFAGLDACVHCGFCLQACPTFLATGDESDSPRGRIELMRALERGDLEVTDTALAYHLDRCLGCRACEPVCPSGVRYGHGLEAARSRITTTRGLPVLARLALWALTTSGVSNVVYWFARLLRATGIPRLLAGSGRFGFSMGMLAATKPVKGVTSTTLHRASPTSTALLFRGCVQQGLFSHVHDATIRTLAVNGHEVREVTGQGCCGALHAHAGDADTARALALRNLHAFEDVHVVVTNSAGCGAALRDVGHWLPEGGKSFAAKARDVCEWLDESGLRPPTGRIDARVCYDDPCHLVHGQKVSVAPRRLLAAIPGLMIVPHADPGACCGAAGTYNLTHPEMSRAVLERKLDSLAAADPDLVVSGNPGCLMQLRAGLAARGMRARAVHPIDLLDRAYSPTS